MVGVALGSFIGLLLAGVLQKLFPSQDLLYIQAALVALFAFLGLLLEGSSSRKGRKE